MVAGLAVVSQNLGGVDKRSRGCVEDRVVMRFKAGPFSASTRSRVGVRFASFGDTTGSRRRRQSDAETVDAWFALNLHWIAAATLKCPGGSAYVGARKAKTGRGGET